jgi:hypothetical protein
MEHEDVELTGWPSRLLVGPLLTPSSQDMEGSAMCFSLALLHIARFVCVLSQTIKCQVT